MNKYKTQEKLKNILDKAEYHELVFAEIKTLVLEKGIANQFIRMFEKNMALIEELQRDVIKTKNFEKLTGVEDLYSMKFKGKNINLRMLYSYDDSSNTNSCIFSTKEMILVRKVIERIFRLQWSV